MGHVVAKEAYRSLRARLDKNSIGAPDTDTMYEILQGVFSEEEARIASKMPLQFTSAGAMARRMGMDARELEKRLNDMAHKGQVFDFDFGGRTRYMLAPTIVGFIEFSMMRVRGDIDQTKLSGLYKDLLINDGTFFENIRHLASFPLRVMVHESSLPDGMYTEVLDYERATHIVKNAGKWAVGLCYCRHVQKHQGHECQKFQMESCISLGMGADWVVRNDLARESNRDEILGLMKDARDAGLVHMADNVQHKPNYLCQCCGCCCEVLLGMKAFKPFEPLFSSNFIATVDEQKCNGCGKCAKACPVEVIDMQKGERIVDGKKVKKLAVVDELACIGCGVCHAECKFDALNMKARDTRRVTPETTFKRVLMAALEQGKLHHLLFDDPESFTMRTASFLTGTILNLPPAKQLLAKDQIRSRFIDAVIGGAKRMGIAGTDM